MALLPRRERSRRPRRGRPWQDARGVMNGILWILRTGAPWADLPERYQPYQTCHRRFQQWGRAGTWPRMLRARAADLAERGGLDLREGFIDGTFAGAKKGAPASGKPNRARWTGERFDVPVAFDPVNRWMTGWRNDVYVWGGQPSPDQSYIVLEVSPLASGQLGPPDLFVTCRTPRGDWSDPRSLANVVNTSSSENFPFFSLDGRRLYFVRDFGEILSIPTDGLCPSWR